MPLQWFLVLHFPTQINMKISKPLVALLFQFFYVKFTLDFFKQKILFPFMLWRMGNYEMKIVIWRMIGGTEGVFYKYEIFLFGFFKMKGKKNSIGDDFSGSWALEHAVIYIRYKWFKITLIDACMIVFIYKIKQNLVLEMI